MECSNTRTGTTPPALEYWIELAVNGGMQRGQSLSHAVKSQTSPNSDDVSTYNHDALCLNKANCCQHVYLGPLYSTMLVHVAIAICLQGSGEDLLPHTPRSPLCEYTAQDKHWKPNNKAGGKL